METQNGWRAVRRARRVWSLGSQSGEVLEGGATEVPHAEEKARKDEGWNMPVGFPRVGSEG